MNTQKLTELLAKVTPGPWSADKWATGYTVSAPASHYSICHLEDCNNDENNAQLIAAAPSLVKRVIELETALQSVITQASGDLSDKDFRDYAANTIARKALNQ